nr:transposase [Rhizohabitans arisaemae]
MILDNLSAHKNWRIRTWAGKHKVRLLFTPTYASWANPIEARFGALRQFSPANSDHRNTRSRPGHCTPTCAGATPTPATPTCRPPNAANAPASTARRASAGAADPRHPQPEDIYRAR